jgi:hypothetical protein
MLTSIACRLFPQDATEIGEPPYVTILLKKTCAEAAAQGGAFMLISVFPIFDLFDAQ